MFPIPQKRRCVLTAAAVTKYLNRPHILRAGINKVSVDTFS